MPVFDPVWAVNGPTRSPTVGEEDQGFACGAADRELFNALFQDVQQAINALDARSGKADIPVNGFQSAPPGSPAEGDRYIVAPTGTGAWAGQDNAIALYVGSQWAFAAPVTGLQANYMASGVYQIIYFDGASWKSWVDEAPFGIPRDIAIYNDAGIFSWVAPENVSRVRAMVWGGGGGGGGTAAAPASYASAGAAGGYSEGVFDVTPGQSYAVVVGVGGAVGAGGASPANGGTGAISSFGAMISATGGNGGVAADGAVQGSQTTGGTGSGGALNVTGGASALAYPIAGSAYILAGGGTPYKAVSPSPVATAVLSNGNTGIVPGGGGGGGGLGGSGGAGGRGLVVLEF
jgi:hypothetical protein